LDADDGAVNKLTAPLQVFRASYGASCVTQQWYTEKGFVFTHHKLT
jgi:hypothetical protein